MTEKYVYLFGTSQSEGDKEMRNLLGGKGANLAEMAQLGLPVPAGFTITTEVCTYYYNHDKTYPSELKGQIERAIAEVEKTMDMRFGDAANPLLLSVRSGARVSMPGMMETVLNLGLNDEIVQGLIEQSGDPRFCYDVYRRFVQMYGDVVMGLRPEDENEKDPFEALLEAKKHARGVERDNELSAQDLRDLVAEFKAEIAKRLDREFPEDPHEQLWNAIGAVFGSWQGQRAIRYREIEGIPHDWGTAVNVQSMVYGNMGDDCATGVAFTRNPSTGEKHLYGEFLINAQGEDVVAGTRTPEPLSELSGQMPRVYEQFQAICDEPHYRDMQDVEFTVQKGKLWMLQTRNGKRTGAAAVQIAVDMVAEGLISQEEALLRVTPDQLDQLLHPTFADSSPRQIIAVGLPASPGAAVGQVVFNSEEAETQAAEDQKVILVRQETSPEDIGGMDAAQGILTARGGASSHAALVARGMGKCCVAGCESITINYHQELFTANGRTVKKGDWISIDGSSGQVMLGQVSTVEPRFSSPAITTLMGWADDRRTLAVRTNADTPGDAEVARRRFGAEGIGLCRTEHMFFEGDRIVAVREMILAEDEAGRRQALAKLKPMQQLDFEGIFTAMDGLPVTIRLLDPPLHEFLPHEPAQQEQMAEEMGVPLSQIEAKITSLHEFNPMLGHRGCRLGITYPEIYEMQVEAIFEAAVNVRTEGINPLPEIMIPLVGTEREFSDLKAMVDRVAVAVGGTIEYLVGTMIEIPRAALLADQIAEEAEFFSFGTNDLTQLTFGYSRDDAGKFLPEYVAQGILADDPFQSLDQDGTGQLVRLGTERGRSTRKTLKVGICGEHGGDPSSVGFCHEVGLDYVSCSPYRVPIARLAAAQAALAQ